MSNRLAECLLLLACGIGLGLAGAEAALTPRILSRTAAAGMSDVR